MWQAVVGVASISSSWLACLFPEQDTHTHTQLVGLAFLSTILRFWFLSTLVFSVFLFCGIWIIRQCLRCLGNHCSDYCALGFSHISQIFFLRIVWFGQLLIDSCIASDKIVLARSHSPAAGRSADCLSRFLKKYMRLRVKGDKMQWIVWKNHSVILWSKGVSIGSLRLTYAKRSKQNSTKNLGIYYLGLKAVYITFL